jgi:hypothetical protein
VPDSRVVSHTSAGRNSPAGDGSVRVITLKGSAAKAALLTSIISSKESRVFKFGGASRSEMRYIECQCIGSVPH